MPCSYSLTSVSHKCLLSSLSKSDTSSGQSSNSVKRNVLSIPGYRVIFHHSPVFEYFSWIILVGFLASCFSFLFCTGQLLFAMGRDGLMPKLWNWDMNLTFWRKKIGTVEKIRKLILEVLWIIFSTVFCDIIFLWKTQSSNWLRNDCIFKLLALE